MRKRQLLLAAGTGLATLCLAAGLAPVGFYSLLRSQHVANVTFGGIAPRAESVSYAATAPGLTFIPFAIDVLSYVTRRDGTVPRNLSLAQLTTIYNCQTPAIQPLLAAYGDANRTLLLNRLGITDATDLVNQPSHTCIKDTDGNGVPIVSNDGRLVTAPNQLLPYSSGPYLAQVNGVNFDKHGATLLGSINGISPQLPNPALPAPSTITYAIRSDSSVPRNLTLGQLADIYNCVNTTFRPLLPPDGPTKTAFLNMIGVNPPGPCVGSATAADDGRVLGSQLQLVPYDIQPYLDQVNNVTFDIHASALLGSIDSVSPTVLNNASAIARDVYNVVPTAKLGVDPWKSMFVGPASAVCGNTATIVRNGFGLVSPASRCGDTSLHS